MKKQAALPIAFACSESFDAMTPESNGRRCASCDTVVVDFTAMEPDAIRAYFEQHRGEKLCGHYRVESTNLPLKKRERVGLRLLHRVEGWKRSRLWQRAAAALLVFALGLGGCRRHVAGRLSAYSYSKPKDKHPTVAVDKSRQGHP